MRPDPIKDTPMNVRSMKGAFALIAVLFAGMIVVASITGKTPNLGPKPQPAPAAETQPQ